MISAIGNGYSNSIGNMSYYGGTGGYGGIGGYGSFGGFGGHGRIGGNSGTQDGECETCKSRKYVDGSNEMVSFKTPGHISPQESFSKVMGHEKEHVANAISEGSKANKELVSVSVALSTSVCPECGTPYVSGGTTTTTMKTFKNDPYSQCFKLLQQENAKGKVIDSGV